MLIALHKPLPINGAVLQLIADRMTGKVKSERMAAAAAFTVGEMRPVVQSPFATFMAEVN